MHILGHAKRAFSITELIVVITIISILSTIGFISYSGYVVEARDAKRIAVLTEAVGVFQKYAISKKLPLPDNAVNISMSGSVIAYQGKMGESVLTAMGMDGDTKDPKDGVYYSYLLGSKRKTFQFVALMEKQKNQFSYLPQSWADNHDRYPRVFGTPLGIILESNTLIPLEELSLPGDTLTLENIGNAHQLSSYISDTEYVTGTGDALTELALLTPRDGSGWRVVDNTFTCFDVNNDGRCPEGATATPNPTGGNPSGGGGGSPSTPTVDPNCYTAPVNTIGAWPGCVDMLIVDRAMLDTARANNPINGGEDYYIEHNGIQYTFGDSANNIFTGQVTSMYRLFRNDANFNANISYWDTSRVTNMGGMFSMFSGTSLFNQPVNFDTSSVTNMRAMFSNAASFNQPINFDTSSVINMEWMFSNTPLFNQPINFTDTSNVTNMGHMFSNAPLFNQPVNFDTSNVTSMRWMFTNATSFNQAVNFDTSNVTNMSSMFSNATSFNQPVNFDTSNVTDMSGIFSNTASFNQAVNFDTSNVTNMHGMFYNATSFNQAVNFDTSNVTSMNSMFSNATSFNQPVNFDTSNVTDMSYMFSNATSFNQPVNFDTSNVTNMYGMFQDATSFNQPVNFDTSNVTNMSSMFQDATSFNQPVNFDTSNVTNMSSMFRGTTSFNQPVNFDTSNVIYMGSMFRGATLFNQDISDWCVTNALTNTSGKPTYFDYNTPAWTPKAGRQPVWGTCP